MRIAGHDLRNPLCLILMAGDLAKRQPALPAGALKYLANINESATQMRRIIDTFLDLRAPQPGAAAGRIDLALLADAVARLHEHAAARKNITLTTEIAADLPLARCDAAHGYQMFTNLVSNALKFTPPGGRVTVRLALAERRLRAEIHDTGPGVPANERAQLFREHARLSPRPTAGEESNGLGLAIVKHLVESQNGSVGTDFPATGGSVFWFELPAA